MFGLGNGLGKSLIKSFIPQIKEALKNKETKAKIIKFLNDKKRTIEPQDNEDDIILVIKTNKSDMFFSLYTAEENNEKLVLSRNVGSMDYDNLINIIDNLLNEI